MSGAPRVTMGALSPGLGSCTCSYKLAPRWWLKTLAMDALTVLRPEVQNRHVSRAMLPPEAPGKSHSSCLPASGSCWHSLACGPITPVFTRPLPLLCVCLVSPCLSLTRIPVTACRAHSGNPGEAPPLNSPNLTHLLPIGGHT